MKFVGVRYWATTTYRSRLETRLPKCRSRLVSTRTIVPLGSRGGEGRHEAAKSRSPAKQDEIGEGLVGRKEAAVPACGAAGIVNELRKASPDAPGYRAHLKPML